MKKNNKKVLIVTTSWNDYIRTLRCIRSLINIKNILFDILIVDNNSTEKNYNILKKSIKKIKKKFTVKEIIDLDYSKKLKKDSKKKIFLIKVPINTGCTGGYNIGYHLGKISGYDYISRIDNDCTVDKDYLEKKVSFLEKNKDYMGINSKVCYLQKKNYIQWVGAKFGYKLIFHRSVRIFKKTKFDRQISANLEKNWKGLMYTDTLNGPGSLIRSEVFKKIKYSDIDFFFGPEDIELSHRIKKLGKIVVMLDSKIYHEVAQSSRLTGQSKRSYYEYKSQILLIKKIYAKPVFYISLLYFIFGLFFQSIFFLFNSNINSKTKISMKYYALKDFFYGRLGKKDLIELNRETNKQSHIKKYIKIFS